MNTQRNHSRRKLFLVLIAVVVTSVLTRAAEAQPFGAWLTLAGNPSHGFIQVPHSPALNPTNRITIEAWVNVKDANGITGCSSLVGKNYIQAWWVGICGTQLRSYLKGGSSSRTAGTIPVGTWTHIAVVFTGTNRIHYINGEQALNVSETGPLTTSTSPLRIGSDSSWQFTPMGSIDDVRIWNVARTQAQIRTSINKDLTGAQAGLVAHYKLNGNPSDARGSHNGTVSGVGTGFLTFPVAPACLPSGTALCLQDRFLVSTKYRTSSTPGLPLDMTASAVSPSSFSSGVLAFPNPDTWQILANVIDACSAPTPRYTVALSSPSTLFTRTEVFDIRAGLNRVYFHFQGPATPAVTDTNAFATCP